MPADTTGRKALDLALTECAEVAAALTPAGNVHESVHAARKGIRRLRALLSLLEATDLELDRADRALRRLGDGLSRLRDSHVVLDAARWMAKKHRAVPWAPVLQQLEQRRDRLLAAALAKDPGFLRRRRVLETVAQLLAAQPWEEVKANAFLKGLKRSRRRAAKAEKHARGSGDAEALHRWRRKVRRLRMQLEALPDIGLADAASSRAERGNRNAKALHKLSDSLGWRQDLRLLRNLVRSMAGIEERRPLLHLIDAESEESSVH